MSEFSDLVTAAEVVAASSLPIHGIEALRAALIPFQKGSADVRARLLQHNPELLAVVERRDDVTGIGALRGRSREARLRTWLALGGTEDDFPAPARPDPEGGGRAKEETSGVADRELLEAALREIAASRHIESITGGCVGPTMAVHEGVEGKWVRRDIVNCPACFAAAALASLREQGSSRQSSKQETTAVQSSVGEAGNGIPCTCHTTGDSGCPLHEPKPRDYPWCQECWELGCGYNGEPCGCDCHALTEPEAGEESPTREETSLRDARASSGSVSALEQIAESYPWVPYEDGETIEGTALPTNRRIAREALPTSATGDRPSGRHPEEPRAGEQGGQSECVCAETSTRNCPVHGQGVASGVPDARSGGET